MEASRREVLTVAAATVTLPMLQAALGVLPQARGQAASAPAEQPGWFTTKLKPAALKDNEFAAVEGHAGVILARTGKDVGAMTSKCTHKGCTIRPRAGVKTLTCACHQAQYNLDGTVAKAPATEALARLAVRTNAEGFIEIDPGQKPTPDAKEYKITIA